jgi:hypothetical protein
MEQQELQQKNKGGRPPKSIKRTIVLSLKCTAEEEELIREKASSASLTVSEYLREAGISTRVIRQKQMPEGVLKQQALWANIASNLNQIAKKRNGLDELTGYERAVLKAEVEDLKRLKAEFRNWLL